jgi:hypothetical protein
MAGAKLDQSPDVRKRRYTELVESRTITRRRATVAATLGLLTGRLGVSADTNVRVQVQLGTEPGWGNRADPSVKHLPRSS